MNRSTITQKIMIFAIFAAIAVYIGVYVYNGLNNPFSTVYAVTYEIDDSYTTSGYIVRDEGIVTAGYSMMKACVSDGSAVKVGQTVAKAYDDQKAYERDKKLETLQARLEQIEYAVNAGSSAASTETSDNEIYSQIIKLKTLVENSAAAKSEETVKEIKSLLLRQAYTYGEISGIDELKDELEREISAFGAGTVSGAKDIQATKSGIFSEYTDGYEFAMRSAMFDDLTPEEWKKTIDAEPQTQDNAIGKIVYGVRWYYVTEIPKEQCDRLQGRTDVTVTFLGDFSEKMKMNIEKITGNGDGDRILILSSSEKLQDIVCIRETSCKIVFDECTGIGVPLKALRFDEENNVGVYCVNGLTATFKKVDVLWKTDDYYIVAEDKTDAYALRLGEEIIVAGKDLYEGKILE